MTLEGLKVAHDILRKAEHHWPADCVAEIISTWKQRQADAAIAEAAQAYIRAVERGEETAWLAYRLFKAIRDA